MSEFEVACPRCGQIKLKNNTWFECQVCGKQIHEVCSNCNTEYFWNGDVHECE